MQHASIVWVQCTMIEFAAGKGHMRVLKYLLGFGEVTFLMQYNAITNDFQSRMTYPDPRKAGGAPSTPGA